LKERQLRNSYVEEGKYWPLTGGGGKGLFPRKAFGWGGEERDSNSGKVKDLSKEKGIYGGTSLSKKRIKYTKGGEVHKSHKIGKNSGFIEGNSAA